MAFSCIRFCGDWSSRCLSRSRCARSASACFSNLEVSEHRAHASSRRRRRSASFRAPDPSTPHSVCRGTGRDTSARAPRRRRTVAAIRRGIGDVLEIFDFRTELGLGDAFRKLRIALRQVIDCTHAAADVLRRHEACAADGKNREISRCAVSLSLGGLMILFLVFQSEKMEVKFRWQPAFLPGNCMVFWVDREKLFRSNFTPPPADTMNAGRRMMDGYTRIWMRCPGAVALQRVRLPCPARATHHSPGSAAPPRHPG